MIAFTSFATGAFIPGQEMLARSALDFGAHRAIQWRRADIQRTAFYLEHRDVLDRPRGAGYWLWKPYIILQELQGLSDGDFLVYSDCGHPEKPTRIRRPLHVLTDWCEANVGGMLPGIYIPRYGRNAIWTKGECFAVMGCDAPMFWDHPQIQAGISVWQKHEASIAFVREWLQWCCVPAAILDERIDPAIPDAPDFQSHRHDQSVLTLLTLKRGLKCIGEPWEGHSGERRINCLIDRITGDMPVESFADKLPPSIRAGAAPPQTAG
jgi:hypothetical protein